MLYLGRLESSDLSGLRHIHCGNTFRPGRNAHFSLYGLSVHRNRRISQRSGEVEYILANVGIATFSNLMSRAKSVADRCLRVYLCAHTYLVDAK